MLYCDSNSLLKSGGSDLHTANHDIGYANNGKYSIEEDLVLPLIKKIKTYNSNSHILLRKIKGNLCYLYYKLDYLHLMQKSQNVLAFFK